MESLSMILLKISGLEQAVDEVAKDVYGRKLSDEATAKFLKKSPTVASCRLSIHTPRPLVEIRNRHPSFLSKKNTKICEEISFVASISSSSTIQRFDMCSDAMGKSKGRPIWRGSQSSSGFGTHGGKTRKNDIYVSASTTGARQSNLEIKNSMWKFVRGYLSEGDLDSSYSEALCAGPVLEGLSNKTACDVLSTLASYFLEQRFTNSIIPCLQQVVDLCTIHGPNYLLLSAKARRELLSAIEEAANTGFPNPVATRSFAQLSMKVHQIWGEASMIFI